MASAASGVAAGMLAPQAEATFADPFFELALLGRGEHAPLAQRLQEDVGLDVEYRACGILRVARTEAERADFLRQHRWQSARGLGSEWLESGELGKLEPLLSGVAGRLLAGGLWLRDEGQVRSPRLARALALAATRCGARIVEGSWATGLLTRAGRATGVMTPTGPVEADTTVLAAGVWSADLGRSVGLDLPIAPVKGQLLHVRAAGSGGSPRQIVWSGECYLVPRVDGEVVLGATEEDGNYDARPTLAGVNRLTEAALELVPSVGRLVVEGLWSGLRPAAPDRHPIVGWAPSVERLMIASAHYRNGVLLGPLTGRLVAQQVLSAAIAPEFAPFGPGRFASTD